MGATALERRKERHRKFGENSAGMGMTNSQFPKGAYPIEIRKVKGKGQNPQLKRIDKYLPEDNCIFV